MRSNRISDLVRNYFSAYESKDRETVEGLLADDFTFTSPLDDRIGREKYFERCWPNSEGIRAFTIEKLSENDNGAFVLYELELNSGVKIRNTEYFEFEGGKIKRVEVYFGDPPAGVSKEVAEAEIRALIDNRVSAVRAKEVETATVSLAPDVLLFDVINPLQYMGSDAVRKRLAEWFSSFQGPIDYEIRDLTIAASDGVAFSHGLNHVVATTIGGGKLDMWWRATVCYRRIDGKWMITHEHASVPFEVKTGRASLGLEP
jgi:ketosteroid isomerase-like protein